MKDVDRPGLIHEGIPVNKVEYRSLRVVTDGSCAFALIVDRVRITNNTFALVIVCTLLILWLYRLYRRRRTNLYVALEFEDGVPSQAFVLERRCQRCPR